MSGDTWSADFPVKFLLTREDKDIYGKNYWLGPEQRACNFILNLGCSQTINGIQLVNTHNDVYKDRSTKQFRYTRDDKEYKQTSLLTFLYILNMYL